MKQFFFWVMFAVMANFAASVEAQQTTQNSWIQIEAQPSLRQAKSRSQAYAGVFQNVNGFAIGSGWYAIVLGPFTEEGARLRRLQLRRENLIPRDSFVVDGKTFRQQFWPVGANTRLQPPVAVTPPVADSNTAAPQPAALPDETPKQARRSEQKLSREQRKLLQTALQWEGFYNAAIDGAFGRGTRRSMAAYQQHMGYEPTGILTSKQRDELVKSYTRVLSSIGMKTVLDEQAGIEIDMPTALVGFGRYEPPFVHYDSKTDSGVKVLLISQAGDQDSLFGLYDIMQTLEIVPMQGARERKKSSFELSGQNDKIHSYTYAALKGGMIKGFTLIWPQNDEKRRAHVVKAMKASFKAIGETALDDSLGAHHQEQRIDLLAGLEIRQPSLSRSGFYVDGAGKALTTYDAVQNCQRITLDGFAAKVSFADEALGIALLSPGQNLFPDAHADFRSQVPRLNSEVAVAGYSYEGALGAATMTFGRLSDIRGLNGEPQLRRLMLNTQDGDVGGPVFDMGGRVLGMLLPKVQGNGKALPGNVNFALSAEALGEILAENGISISVHQSVGAMAPEDLTDLGRDLTVLVQCWN
ncbi:MAG: peptidoglycan-binding protein [Rhodobacterales bacterium]|nr:MAG: peptidoglycan-binding protein [Rhodobacterales bacterium]